MRIIVSSKHFAEFLSSSKIVTDDDIRLVKIRNGKFYVVKRGDSFSMNVESKETDETVIQDNVRWDWLYRDIRAIQEQPVCIEFLDNVARFTLSY